MSLKKQAMSGAKWTTTSTSVISVIDFARVAVLARLLNSTDFGLMSMISVVIGFSQSFVDMGISNAIIHRQDVTRDQLSSLYWLNIFAGIIVFCLVMAISSLIETFYNEPRLKSLIPWAALNFLIIPIGQQFQILLQKELRFERLAKIEMLSAIASMAVAIVAARQGYGVFALIWGTLTNTALRTFALVWTGWNNWRPCLHFRRIDLKGYISFGLYQMGERSMNYFSANADYLFIGRFLGPKILGVYTLAYHLVVLPLIKINPILTRVAFPVFSKRQTDNAALRRGYLEMIKLLAFIAFPVLVGLAVVSPLFVQVIYGKGWEMAIPLIQILSFLGILKVLGNPLGSVILAKGRADIGFKCQILVVVMNTTAFWFTAQRGVFVLAQAWVVLCVFYFFLNKWILGRVIGLEWKEFLSVLISPTIRSILMGCITYSGYLILSNYGISKIISLVSLVILGIIVYGLFVLLFERRYFLDLLNLTFKRNQAAI